MIANVKSKSSTCETINNTHLCKINPQVCVNSKCSFWTFTIILVDNSFNFCLVICKRIYILHMSSWFILCWLCFQDGNYNLIKSPSTDFCILGNFYISEGNPGKVIHKHTLWQFNGPFIPSNSGSESERYQRKSDKQQGKFSFLFYIDSVFMGLKKGHTKRKAKAVTSLLSLNQWQTIDIYFHTWSPNIISC